MNPHIDNSKVLMATVLLPYISFRIRILIKSLAIMHCKVREKKFLNLAGNLSNSTIVVTKCL